MKMLNRELSEQELRDIVASSKTVCECFRKINKSSRVGRGNYKSFYKILDKLNISIQHFCSNTIKTKNAIAKTKRPIEVYLANEFPLGSHKLKNRLLKEGIFQRKCSECSLDTWRTYPIPLELDHIDGNHENNFLCNLRLLCPNCHALTNNYAGKNVKNRMTRTCHCGEKISNASLYCKKHSPKRKKIEWPELVELNDMLEKYGYLKTGRILGVSDNAIRQHLRAMGSIG